MDSPTASAPSQVEDAAIDHDSGEAMLLDRVDSPVAFDDASHPSYVKAAVTNHDIDEATLTAPVLSTPTSQVEVAVTNQNVLRIARGSILEPEAQTQHPDAYTYIFTSPYILSTFFNVSTTHRLQGHDIRHIRLCILEQLSTAPLTAGELRGKIDGQHAPHVAPHIEAWRRAFRKFPGGKDIQTIEFDMRCPGKSIALGHIGKPLQYMSTFASVKTQNRVRCSVSGCEDEARERLGRCIVNGKVGS